MPSSDAFVLFVKISVSKLSPLLSGFILPLWVPITHVAHNRYALLVGYTDILFPDVLLTIVSDRTYLAANFWLWSVFRSICSSSSYTSALYSLDYIHLQVWNLPTTEWMMRWCCTVPHNLPSSYLVSLFCRLSIWWNSTIGPQSKSQVICCYYRVKSMSGFRLF